MELMLTPGQIAILAKVTDEAAHKRLLALFQRANEKGQLQELPLPEVSS